jgi:hypothetical protein
MYSPTRRSGNLASRKIWLLKLVLPSRNGRLLTGALLFAVLFPFFYLGVLEETDESAPALFFSLSLANSQFTPLRATETSRDNIFPIGSC